MPVAPVLLELAGLGDLGQLRFQLLQADDVGPLSPQPFGDLRLPGPNAVDIPGGDFHLRGLE